jgi:hypothetical protein
MSKYINPYTDFGFKKLFGEEANSVRAVAVTAREEALVEGMAIGKEEGIIEGIVIGEAIGEAKQNKKTILKLYQKGKAAHEISELLDIPLVEAQKVIAELLKT